MIIVPTFIFILSLDSSVNPNSYQSSWSLSHKLEKDIASGGKRSESWNNYYNDALNAFEQNDLAEARGLVYESLNILKNKSELNLDESVLSNYYFSSYELMARIYNRARDYYQSSKYFLRANEYSKSMTLEDNIEKTVSLDKEIDRQFERLTQQGLESIIDKKNMNLRPMDTDWFNSMLRINSKNSSSMEERGDEIKKLYLIETAKPYTGWVNRYNDNAKLEEFAHYRMGLRDGLSYFFKNDSRSTLVGPYHDGVMTGLHVEFDGDSKVKESIFYLDGYAEGSR